MKYQLFLISILFFIVGNINISDAQEVSIDNLLKKPQKDIQIYDTSKFSQKAYILNYDFASDLLKNKSTIDSIKKIENNIEKIDLVYSKFAVSSTFNQEELNKKRLEHLQEEIPQIFENKNIKWSFYRQTDAKNIDDAKKTFHGFVVFEKPEPISTPNIIDTTTTTRLKEILETVGVDTVISSDIMIRQTGYYLPVSERKRKKGIKYKKKFIWKRKLETVSYSVYDTSYVTRGDLPEMSDSVVTSVFNRDVFDWEKSVILVDVTGSMFNYILQTLVWVKLHIDNTSARHFAFYNDGDDHPDGRIGKSRGVYTINSKNSDAIAQRSYFTMDKGWGGKGPENDIEAILVAIDSFPDCEAVVLIADNYASVRDMSLLPKVTVPVKIVLCGATDGYINTQYLEIALKTGGSIHTIEEDITNFTEMENGDIITIGKNKYSIKNNKFKLVK